VKIPSSNAKRRARIEIIPLIDIVFFLLATFIVVSLSMVKNEGLSVNLPKATTGTSQSTAHVITVKENGDVYFNKDKVTLTQLTATLTPLKNNPDMSIIINGDEKADFGNAIQVLDTVRQLGIDKVAIRTKK